MFRRDFDYVFSYIVSVFVNFCVFQTFPVSILYL